MVPPCDTYGARTDPETAPVECSRCGHIGAPAGKGQCAECRCWLPRNTAAMRHGLRRYQDTGILPDDLREYRAERYAELVEALGGQLELSPQRAMLAGHAINLEVTAALQLDYAIRTGADKKRGREALADYRATVTTLKGVLATLGLEREPQKALSVEEYVRERAAKVRGEHEDTDGADDGVASAQRDTGAIVVDGELVSTESGPGAAQGDESEHPAPAPAPGPVPLPGVELAAIPQRELQPDEVSP